MLFTTNIHHVQLVVAGLTVFALSFFYFTSSTSHFPNYYASQSSVHSVFHDSAPWVELEQIVMGKPFDVARGNTTLEERLEKLSADLIDRFANLDVNTYHPECSINLTRYDSSGILADPSSRYDTKQRISIALNLYNSEDILPSLSLALLGLVHHLHPTHQIYISIFENGSNDKTRDLLGNLAPALFAAGINGLSFRSTILQRPQEIDRIVALANIRNEAILPLLPHAADGVLLFVNDVVTCTSDLLELIHQQRLQRAHGVMSTDWDYAGGQPRFRDVWVARGINGELPYSMREPSGFTEFAPSGNWGHDLFSTQDEAVYQRWLDGRPLPVYSGWNGAIAFDAKIFTDYHVRFRASGKAHWDGGDATGAMGLWGELLATEGYLDSDCASSECKLIARDVWNMLGNATRFALAPQSRTAYSMADWNLVVGGNLPPTRRTDNESWQEDVIDWANVTMPAEVVCAPSLTEQGDVIDPWDNLNTRLRFSESCENNTSIF